MKPLTNTLSSTQSITDEKKQVILNLYVSGIPEEFIAMQLDEEIPAVIAVLKEFGINTDLISDRS